MLSGFSDPSGSARLADTLAGDHIGPGLGPLLDKVAELYVTLVDRPSATRRELVTQDRPDHLVDLLLDILGAWGMATVQADGQVTPTPPDIALPAQAVRLERQAAAALAATSELSRRYYAARAAARRGVTDQVTWLYSVEEIGAATAEAVAAGTTGVLAMRAPTQRILNLATMPPEVQRIPFTNSQGRTLPTRVVYDSRLLQVTQSTSALAERAAFEQQRVFPDLPWTVTVVDDRAAIIDISAVGRPGPQGVLLLTPVMVEPVATLVERFWSLGLRVPRAESAPLDRRDQQILALLGSGASDATIARQANVSQRTIERRIKLLLDELGAHSRFQAGMLAKERGWL